MSRFSHMRASDVIYIIFPMHVQTVDTRLSFSTHPAIELWDEAIIMGF